MLAFKCTTQKSSIKKAYEHLKNHPEIVQINNENEHIENVIKEEERLYNNALGIHKSHLKDMKKQLKANEKQLKAQTQANTKAEQAAEKAKLKAIQDVEKQTSKIERETVKSNKKGEDGWWR
jgi:hypothetical protein